MPVTRTTFDLPAGTFHALELGDRDARPLVWLHGFPDHPPTAAAFLERFAGTHRVIAPWLRGYAPSPVVGPYDVQTLARDVIALISQLEQPVDLVGHDWGAILTYMACALEPTRIRRAVTLAVPHPLTFLEALTRSSQALRSWYIAAFQLPGAEHALRARNFAFLERAWRGLARGFTLDPAAWDELRACLDASLPGPIEYYRAAARPLRGLRDRLAPLQAKLTTPILQLHGSEDTAVLPPRTDDSHRFTERELVVIQGAGHFLHLDQPESIGGRIERWLG